MSWVHPGKLAEYFEHCFPGPKEADKQIFHAVIRGEIRSKATPDGPILGAEQLKRISRHKWDPDSDFGLPGDLGLSVEDAEEVFAGLQTDRSILN